MRDITPRPSMARPKRKPFLPIFLVLTLLVAGGVVYFFYSKKQTTADNKTVGNVASDTTDTSETTPVTSKNTTKSYTTLKQFTGEQFHSLYDTFVYPNTREIETPPEITGVPEVDDYIRNLAVSRGYKLRTVPVAEITKKGQTVLDEPFLLQDKASVDWDALTKAAADEGYELGVTSAFRSIKDQRDLFMQEYNNAKIVTAKVTSGAYDKTLNDILALAAIPGYSRHHTGYTLDFSCDKGSAFVFKNSRCYSWVSSNNFENIKKFGWIPSYPEGTPPQGPNPEPWEFVWVGKDALYE